MNAAGQLLIEASNWFSNAGCNDWKWPPDWTYDERVEMAIMMVAQNTGRTTLTDTDQEEVLSLVNGEYGPPDWWVARFLGRILSE